MRLCKLAPELEELELDELLDEELELEELLELDELLELEELELEDELLELEELLSLPAGPPHALMHNAMAALITILDRFILRLFNVSLVFV